MNDLDRKIQEALRGIDGGNALAREPNVAEELIGTFRTRHRWLHAVAFIFTFAFFAIAVWGGIRFANADVPRDQILWAGVCTLGMLSVGFLKIYFWMEIHTNRVLREIKRVELLILESRRTTSDSGH